MVMDSPGVKKYPLLVNEADIDAPMIGPIITSPFSGEIAKDFSGSLLGNTNTKPSLVILRKPLVSPAVRYISPPLSVTK